MDIFSEDYERIRAEKLRPYFDEFPVREHLLYPIEEILRSIRAIIGDYKRWDTPDKWYLGAAVLRRNMYQLSAEETKNLLYGHKYRDLFSFLRPNEERKRRLVDYFDYHDIPPIPPEKMPRYLEVISEIAKDCIELCLEEMKEDAKREVEANNVKFAERVGMVNALSEDERLELARKNQEANVEIGYDKPYYVDKILEVRFSEGDSKIKAAKTVSWSESVTGGETDRKRYIKEHKAAKKQSELLKRNKRVSERI
jgi:hypothetical protein